MFGDPRTASARRRSAAFTVAVANGDVRAIAATLDGLGGHESHAHMLCPRLDGRKDAPVLVLVAENGHVAAAECLLDRGVDVNHSDDEGVAPLHAACMNGDTAMVELLIDRGADVNKEAKYNGTPLVYAMRFGCVGGARLLLAAGAEVDAADKNGARPLWIASAFDRAAAVELLLEYGADVDLVVTDYAFADQCGGDETSPLGIAADHASVEAARVLLERGAKGADDIPEVDSPAILDLLREHFRFVVLRDVVGPRGEHPGRRIEDLAPLVASFLVPRLVPARDETSEGGASDGDSSDDDLSDDDSSDAEERSVLSV
mmetsp:Transcript_25867/g.77687  ORF Transcript_25867/g.77687 Transcript_25867/m.77687 type:complete len:317 (+) Transcript_25867:238-1188(+)